jgi:hypothetical protein
MNKTLSLDFVPSSIIPLFGNIWLSVAVFLLGLMAAGETWQINQHQQSELLQINRQLNQVNEKSVKKHVAKELVQVDISAEKKLQIEETVTALTLPWEALLEAVEKPDMHDVAMLSINPNVKSQQIVLEAEAKNLQAALHYVEALQKQTVFDKVYLQRHAIEETDVSKPVKFTVFAHWQLVEG